ncbi:unnamed protein product [Aphanomyces euteiches]
MAEAAIKLDRPIPGETRDDDGFRKAALQVVDNLTQETLQKLVALRQSGVLPGLFFRDTTFLTSYVLPLLPLAVDSSKVVDHVKETATKNNDTSVVTLLSRSNVELTTQDVQINHDGYRAVGALGDYTVVHWPGLPDAFDTYVLGVPSPTHPETIDLLIAATAVSSDFNKAMTKYAPMWVNPLDFALNSTQTFHSGSIVPPPPKKRKVDTTILQRLQGDAASAVATLLKESAQPASNPLLYGHLNPSPAPTVKTAFGVDQPSAVVPSCSRWFSLHSVHPLEKRMLPEFFQDNKSKTPQIYMTYRNYMVNASRAAPHVYLTATACRRNLAGDACSILRVHEFLTHWGLINYNVPAHAAPQGVPPTTSFDMPPVVQAPLAIAQEFSCESCGQPRVDYELTADAKRKERIVQHGMPLRKLDAWGVRPGSGICDQCFAKHKFPSHLDPSDFAAVTPFLSVSSWSDDEIDRLLDALNKMDTTTAIDWNEVALVVGKPAKDCVAQFLKLPLESHAQKPQEQPPAHPTSKARVNYPYISAVSDVAEIVASADPSLVQAATAAAIAHLDKLNQPKQDPARETKGTTAATTGGAQALAKSAKDAGMTIKEEASTHEAAAKTQTTAAVAVAVLAARAHGIAKQEEGTVKELMADLLQCQMQHIQLKLKSLEYLESALQAERDQLSKERYELYVDKLNTAQAKLSASIDE